MNELTKKEDGALSVQSQSSDWGMALPDVMSLTLDCSVGQPSNKTKKEIGKFNFSDPEWKPTDKLTNLVIVHPDKNRALFGKGFGGPRRCGSDNFVRPSQFIKDPISDNCMTCFAAKWENELIPDEIPLREDLMKEVDAKPSNKPICTQIINLVVMDDRKRPFTLRFMKTQIKLVQEKLINRIIYKGKRPFQVMFDLSLVQVGSNSYYDYSFDNLRDVPAESQKEYADMFEFFSRNGTRLLGEQHAKQDYEKEVGEDQVPF